MIFNHLHQSPLRIAEVGLVGKQIKEFAIREFDCSIGISGGYGITVACLGRFVGTDKCFLCVNDHKQMFGLPAPFDEENEIRKRLLGHKIINVIVREITSDVTLCIDGGQFEIICNSSGYESYQIYGPDNLIIIGRGGA